MRDKLYRYTSGVVLGILIHTTIISQTEYHWTYPECSGAVDNICAFEDRTLVVNAIWCQEEEVEYQVHVVALEEGVEVAETSYDSTRLLFSFPEDDRVNLIIRTSDALQMVSLNPQLEEVAVYDLGLPYSAHIFNAVKLQAGYLVTSLSGTLVSFTVYNASMEVIDSHTMPEPTLAFPSKLTFAELLENGKVLVSLFCDRTIYLELDNLGNSQWIQVQNMNCNNTTTMVFDPDLGGAFCAMSSMIGADSDLDEIWMIFHDEFGATSSYFTIATELNLWAGAAEIQENTINYSALTRVITQTVDSADFAFYRTDLEGNLYFSYEHHTPDRWEYAPYLTETPEGFWLYSSDRDNNAELLDAFALYIPKSIVAIEESSDFTDENFVVDLKNGSVLISHTTNLAFEAGLYDLNGRQIDYDRGTAVSIDTSSLASGYYVLLCRSSKGTFVKKIALISD